MGKDIQFNFNICVSILTCMFQFPMTDNQDQKKNKRKEWKRQEREDKDKKERKETHSKRKTQTRPLRKTDRAHTQQDETRV